MEVVVTFDAAEIDYAGVYRANLIINSNDPDEEELRREVQLTTSDGIPPAAITDLAVTAVYDNYVVLDWTAPGDNGTKGRAHSYDIR